MYIEFGAEKKQVVREKDGFGQEHLYLLSTLKIKPLKMEVEDDVEEHYFNCYEYLNALHDHVKFVCSDEDKVRFLVESDLRVERGLWKQAKELTPRYFANVFDAYFIEFNTSRSVQKELMEPSLELVVVIKSPYINSEQVIE